MNYVKLVFSFCVMSIGTSTLCIASGAGDGGQSAFGANDFRADSAAFKQRKRDFYKERCAAHARRLFDEKSLSAEQRDILLGIIENCSQSILKNIDQKNYPVSADAGMNSILSESKDCFMDAVYVIIHSCTHKAAHGYAFSNKNGVVQRIISEEYLEAKRRSEHGDGMLRYILNGGLAERIKNKMQDAAGAQSEAAKKNAGAAKASGARQ